MAFIFTYELGAKKAKSNNKGQANNKSLPVNKKTNINWQKTGIIILSAIFMAIIMAINGAKAQNTNNNQLSQLFTNDSLSDRWSGFYFGASLGAGWGQSVTFYDRAGDDHPTRETANPLGYLASFSLGYNQQIANNLVLGLEGEIGMMNLSAPDRLNMWDGHIWKSQFGGVWGSLRPKLGWAMDNMMVYGTAGFAFMQTNEIILGDNDATQNTYNQTIHTGIAFGGGVEYALTDNISAKLEYLHMQFPEYQSYTNNEELYGFTNSAGLLKVGLNHKF